MILLSHLLQPVLWAMWVVRLYPAIQFVAKYIDFATRGFFIYFPTNICFRFVALCNLGVCILPSSDLYPMFWLVFVFWVSMRLVVFSPSSFRSHRKDSAFSFSFCKAKRKSLIPLAPCSLFTFILPSRIELSIHNLQTEIR